MNSNHAIAVHFPTHNQSGVVSQPFGVHFELCSKRWVCDWTPKPLQRFHGTWAANPTSTSSYLAPILSQQQRINVSGHIFSPIWVKFEPLSLLGNLWSLCTEFYSWGLTFVANTFILMEWKKGWKGHVCSYLVFSEFLRSGWVRNVRKPSWGFLQIFLFDTCAEVPLHSNEASWRSLLVVEIHSYRLVRLTYLTRTFSYSVCSIPRGAPIQLSGRWSLNVRRSSLTWWRC